MKFSNVSKKLKMLIELLLVHNYKNYIVIVHMKCAKTLGIVMLLKTLLSNTWKTSILMVLGPFLLMMKSKKPNSKKSKLTVISMKMVKSLLVNFSNVS